MLLTRAPVAGGSIATPPLPLDLHVLSLSLAFILSQDQTLRCCLSFLFLFYFINRAGKQESKKDRLFCSLFCLHRKTFESRPVRDVRSLYLLRLSVELTEPFVFFIDSCTTFNVYCNSFNVLCAFIALASSGVQRKNFAKVNQIFETCKSFRDFNICLTFHHQTIQCLSAFQSLSPRLCEVCFSKSSAKVDTFSFTSKFFMVF